MRSGIIFTFLVAFTCAAAAAQRKDYSGYTVLRADIATSEQFQFLAKLRDESLFDFWSGPHPGKNADIMTDYRALPALEELFASQGISYSVMVDNVGRLIQRTAVQNPAPNQGEMNWDDYQSLPTIYSWFDSLQAANPGKVEVQNIGKSFEDRDLKLIKVTNGDNVPGKPAIWIDGTIHAREWIATSTATYVLNQLVNNASQYQDILNAVNFYLVPVVNPDGYEFSRNFDRLWRKTRSNTINPSCPGVDANRNFGFKWSSDGSSSNPCSLTYCGAEPYSESEAAAVRDYIINNGGTINWQAFVTLHSYSQLWMTPWGYTYDLPENFPEAMRVANSAVAALTANFNTRYQAGSAANILYISSGTSRDWAAGEGNFTYIYTIELRDTGTYGFLLPPNQILPTGIETWSGLQVLAQEVANMA